MEASLPVRRTGDIMPKLIGVYLNSATRGAVRGLAVLVLVVVWSVGHIGTYALGVVGLSSVALTTTAAPADAGWRGGWRGRRWRRRGWRRRWWR